MIQMLSYKREIKSQTYETNLGLPNEEKGAEQIRNLGLINITYIK